MNKHLKRIMSAAVSAAIVSAGAVFPAFAADYTPLIEGDTVINEWKFDFGAAGSSAEDGYTLVTPDKNVIVDKDYGFINNDGKAYLVNGINKYDSFSYQEGQTMNLAAGENGGIGIVPDDSATYPEYTTGDYYPVSFGLYVDNGSYYRVRATVTTLDPSEDATASLFYERRHPVYKEVTINAGEEYTVDFSVDVETINFKNEGNFVDDMLNISLLGDNAALAKLDIQQIDESKGTATTLWVLGDSTVTDGGASVPYFDLQNYTGVGAYLSKYLPSNIAVSNQGEGGLNATDNNHFAIARDNIKAGDFMYVEYGHNHKNNENQSFTSEYWLNDYLSSLPKYYNACRDADATLIIVGPIDRHNSNQYDSATNTWSSTLNSFSGIGEKYVQCLKYGGEETAAEFLAKWSEIADFAEKNKEVIKVGSITTVIISEDAIADLNALKAEADEICSDAVAGGSVQIENVAFVDLNQPTLDWLTEVTASGTVDNQAVTNDIRLTNFYFTTARGGRTDGTHPNDAGADALAYRFFTTADTEEYPVLEPLMKTFTDGTNAKPTPIDSEIINAGWPSNSFWPIYDSPVSYDYALKIDGVNFNEETGVLESMDVTIQDNTMMSTYGQGIVAVYNAESGVLEGVAMSGNHIDNTTQGGSEKLTFETDVTYNPETQTYKAFVWGYEDNPAMGNPTIMQSYARAYVPTDIEVYLLPGEESDVENFVYYGTTTLDKAGDWSYGGSMDKDLTLGVDESGVTYATLKVPSIGADKNSYYVLRPFSNLDGGTGAAGKYMFSVDLQYISGQGATFGFTDSIKTSSPFIGTSIPMFEIGADGAVLVNGEEAGKLLIGEGRWTNVTYILDMDMGTATVTVGGNSPVTIDMPNYTSTSAVIPSTLTGFYISGNRSYTFDMKMSNLTCAKLKSSNLEDKTITVSSADEEMGTVSIDGAGGETSYTAVMNSMVSISAVPKEGYEFVVWQTPDGEPFSYSMTLDVRLHEDINLTAVFEEAEYDPITYMFNENFSGLTTSTLSANGWTSLNAQDLLIVTNSSEDAIGNYLDFTMTNRSRGAVKDFGGTLTSDQGVAVKMDFKLKPSSNEDHHIALHGGNLTYAEGNVNYGVVDGDVLLIKQDKSGATTINGSATTIPVDTWVSMTAVCDFAAHTIDVTVTSLDGSASYFSQTVAMDDTEAEGLTGLYLRSARDNGSMAIDNLKIFTADQLTAE